MFHYIRWLGIVQEVVTTQCLFDQWLYNMRCIAMIRGTYFFGFMMNKYWGKKHQDKSWKLFIFGLLSQNQGSFWLVCQCVRLMFVCLQQTEGPTVGWWHIDSQRDRSTERPIDRQTDIHADRHTNKKTQKNKRRNKADCRQTVGECKKSPTSGYAADCSVFFKKSFKKLRSMKI